MDHNQHKIMFNKGIEHAANIVDELLDDRDICDTERKLLEAIVNEIRSRKHTIKD